MNWDFKCFIGFLLLYCSVAKCQTLIIQPEKVQSDFLGMGFNKIPAIDFNSEVYNTVIGKRIKEVASNGYYRIFEFSTTWYAPNDSTLDFDSPKMKAYINKLQMFRQFGIKIIHTQEYNGNPDWLGGGKLVTDTVLIRKMAKIYAIGMEWLIIKKGFTNIHSWELTNELCLKDKIKWGAFYFGGDVYKKVHKDIIRMVREEFDKRGLKSLVIRTPGISDNELWRWGTDNHPESSISDMHWYFKSKEPWSTTWDIGNGTTYESTDSMNWFYPIQYDHHFQFYKYRFDYAKRKGKELAIGEFGPTVAGEAKMPIGSCYYETAYGETGTGKLGIVIAEQAMAMLNAGVKTIQKWCFADLKYPGNPAYKYYHGTMKDSIGKWQTRSDYYSYGLMTRYIRSNSSVYKTISSDSLLRMTAVKNNKDNKWTIVVMNRKDKSETISIQNKVEDKPMKYRRFVYRMDSVPQNRFGDLQSYDKELVTKSGSFSDSLPANSMALYTTEFEDAKMPMKVMELKLAYSTNEINLKWKGINEKEVCYYRVYESTDANFIPNKNNQIGSTIGTSFKVLNSGTTLNYFKVRAVDKYGIEGK